MNVILMGVALTIMGYMFHGPTHFISILIPTSIAVILFIIFKAKGK